MSKARQKTTPTNHSKKVYQKVHGFVNFESELGQGKRFPNILHCTEMRFASFLSGGFITAMVVNPPERRLAKCTSVHCKSIHNQSESDCSKTKADIFKPKYGQTLTFE